MITFHRQGYLTGESRCGEDVCTLTTGQYDLAIVSPSWDRRCLSLTGGDDLHAKYGIVLLYEARDRQGLRNKHDKILLEYISAHTENVTKISGRSVDVEKLWPKLFSKIKSVSSNTGRPLRVFLDLSTFSRYYAIAILATCLGQGIAESFTVFYAEGAYEKTEREYNEIAFSTGRWKTVTIPSLEGTWDPGKQKYYLVSVGFEGSKTLQVISKEDPDRISILFPKPGILPEYVRRTEEANKVLRKRFQVPQDQIINVRAGDAIGVWKALDEAKVERPEKENTFYLCCGTKPHAVGLALRGLCVGYPVVLYRVPAEHKVVDVEPKGTYWRFDIRDLSAPPPLE